MADLGKRFKCYKCGTKFYDLNKPAPVCPSCGEDQNNEETKKILRRKKRRPIAKAKSDARAVPEEMEGVAEGHEDVEEYVLDMEDIVLEESSDYKEKDE